MQKFGLYDVFNCYGSREDAGGINISGITTLHRNLQLNTYNDWIAFSNNSFFPFAVSLLVLYQFCVVSFENQSIFWQVWEPIIMWSFKQKVGEFLWEGNHDEENLWIIDIFGFFLNCDLAQKPLTTPGSILDHSSGKHFGTGISLFFGGIA